MRGVIAADTCIRSIKRCRTLNALNSVHAVMLKTGLSSNIFFSTNLVAHYAATGSIRDAYALFSSTVTVDVFFFNVMLRGFVDCGGFDSSLLIYSQMRRLGTIPDHFTFPFLLKAARYLADFPLGYAIHREVIRFGYAADVVVCNSIIAMYGYCGRTDLARHLFDEMPHTTRSSITWSSMIGAYARNGCYQEGLLLFRWYMMAEDISVSVSRSTLLNVMACVFTENDAHNLFKLVLASSHGSDQSVQNAAMRMFARAGRIDLSRSIFLQVLDKDLVSWSSMIEAYVQADSPIEAFNHFVEMTLNGIRPDYVTLLSVVRACCSMRSLQQACLVHGIILRNISTFQVSLGTALIDLYVKCGNMKYARSVFDGMQERNSITWSTMISGYGTHGQGKEALHLYDQMRTKENPDHIMFVSVLSACSHAGLVAEGWECFESMERDFGIRPQLEHYACMVDLLGRAGQLDDAYHFIKGMPIAPGIGVWGSLLGACQIHSNFELAEQAARALLELDAYNPGRYVLLSNIYASSGKKAEAEKIRKLIKERGLKKCVGQTCIQLSVVPFN
ncbi:hypothetical protein QQ045_004376 [Rhodiola kirilowii]